MYLHCVSSYNNRRNPACLFLIIFYGINKNIGLVNVMLNGEKEKGRRTPPGNLVQQLPGKQPSIKNLEFARCRFRDSERSLELLLSSDDAAVTTETAPGVIRSQHKWGRFNPFHCT